MDLRRLEKTDQRDFAEAPESAMDFHLGRSRFGEFYLVIGCRVGIALNEKTFAEPQRDYLEQPWLGRGLSTLDREGTFERWLSELNAAPNLATATPAQAWQSYWGAMSPVT